MAIPISALPLLSAVPSDAADIPLVQSSVTKRVKYSNLRSKTIAELAALTDGPEDADLLRVSDAGTEKKIAFSNLIKDLRVTVPVVISAFIDRNTRNLDANWNGVLQAELTGQALNSGAPIGPHDHGIGKLIIVINAGSDVSGTITVTGDTIDRNTGAITAADTDDIVIDAVSTDNSTTDAEGNTIHAIAGGYITSKWFSGATTLSTTDVNLSDVDIYHCSFEQVNDSPNMTMQTFDINIMPSNTAAWFYGYLYSIIVTGSKVTINNEATLAVPVGESTADKYYRLRKGNLSVAIDGSKDGFFVDLFFGPNSQTYWQDITMKVWFEQELALSNI